MFAYYPTGYMAHSRLLRPYRPPHRKTERIRHRHHRLNDPEIDHILWGVASFRLDDLKLENPDLKGLKIKVRSPYGTEVRTCDFEKEDSGEDAISGTQEKSVSTYVR